MTELGAKAQNDEAVRLRALIKIRLFADDARQSDESIRNQGSFVFSAEKLQLVDSYALSVLLLVPAAASPSGVTRREASLAPASVPEWLKRSLINPQFALATCSPWFFRFSFLVSFRFSMYFRQVCKFGSGDESVTSQYPIVFRNLFFLK